MKIGVKFTNPDAKLPVKMLESDGWDVYATRDHVLHGMESLLESRGSIKNSVIIDSGLIFDLPENYPFDVRPRSGLAAKHNITVTNTPALIDANFRGELSILLINHGWEDFFIKSGDRIAQITFPVLRNDVEFYEVNEVSETSRGKKGLGSTQ